MQNPFANGNWNLVDYIGLVLSRESAEALQKELSINKIESDIMISNDSYSTVKEQVVTVAYSYSRVNYNPLYQDLDGELYMPIDRIITVPAGLYRWHLFTDQYTDVKSLALELDSDFIRNLHQMYIDKQNADWYFDSYIPMIRIKNRVSLGPEDLSGLPLPKIDLVFDRVKYSRFTEQIK